MTKRLAVRLLAAAVLCVPLAAGAYSNVFIFGDSLSDPGNNRIVFDGNGMTGFTAVPIPNNAFIPVLPYQSTRYTNADVWATAFAETLGLTALPALAGGTNFAFGGATTGPSPSGFPFSLRHQVENQFLPAFGGSAPSDALYVIAGGGNNARNAINAIAAGADPLSTIVDAAVGYAVDTSAMILSLRQAGAEDFIVWNVPNAGTAPAILASDQAFPGTAALASLVSAKMNSALVTALNGIPGLDDGVKVFDLYGLVTAIAANPVAYGLANATDACAQFAGCDPSTYLFWDGIHPTSAGHAIIAQSMIALVPEPSTYALMIVGLLAVGVVARARRLRG